MHRFKLIAPLIIPIWPVVLIAGGSERSAPSPNILFKSGNVAEFRVSYSEPSVDGAVVVGAFGEQQSGNMAESTLRVGVGIKKQLNDRVSYALVFEQPHWARTNYGEADERYPYRDSFAKLSEDRLTFWGKYQASDTFSVYGGPMVSRTRLSARVAITVPDSVDGTPVAVLDYSGSAPQTSAMGYALGVALENQSKAQRLSLTYFSELNFDTTGTERASSVNTSTGESFIVPESNTDLSYKLPQSLTLAAQTGLNKKTLLFGSVRWADWSEYRIAPTVFEMMTGGALSNLDNDAVTLSIGIGRKLNGQASLFAQAGYEKSRGGLKGNLSPGDGRKSFALGGKYRMGDYEVRAGIQHTLVGDAKTNAVVGESDFSDNSATSVGLSLTTKF